MKTYNPRSYFFTELSKLADSSGTEGFGPVNGSESTQFRITSKVKATNPNDLVKLYAISGGSMLIQPQDNDNTKINIIIKPSKNNYAPLKIKYFIYRGVNKSDYFTGDLLNQPDASKPKTLNRMWAVFMALNGISSPVGAIFPLDYIYQLSAPETKLIDDAFQSSLVSCKEGEYIGNFKGEVGLDIVLDYGEYTLDNQEILFNLDLKFARAKDYIFDVSTLSDNVKKKRLRENIHQFLDAAAFWGSHINSGTITLNDSTKKINVAGISPILKKYQTKNKVYVYLQGENNRSFNYYDTSRMVYGFTGSTGELNDVNGSGWPLLIKEITGTSGSVKFQFDYSINDPNIAKTERNISVDLIASNKTDLSKYPFTERPDTLTGKTKEVKVEFPMNSNVSCANFAFLSARTVQSYPVDQHFNNLWIANIKSSININTNTYKMHWCMYDKSINVNLNDTINESAVLQNKVVFDEGKKGSGSSVATKRRRLFTSVIKKNSRNDDEYNKLNTDRASFGYVKENKTAKEYFLNVFNDAKFSIYKGSFTEGSSIVNSLTLFHENSLFKKYSYMLLGITEDEYNKFTIPAGSDNIYFNLEEDSTFPINNVRKFRLGLRCEDSSGIINSTIIYPSAGNDVYVYSLDDLFFFSSDFSEYQEYYNEFSKNKVEFRTIMDQSDSSYVFNPSTSIPASIPFYKGDFGFDWLRIGDNGESPYNGIIDSGYERPYLGDLNTEYETSNEADKFLKRRYKSLPTQKTDEQYFIPYLNIFSQVYSANSKSVPKPTYQARLRVLVELEETVNKLEFDYDKSLFTISKTILADKNPTSPVSKKESIDQTITITCLKSFSEAKAIKVLAYPVGVNDKAKAKLAGIIWVNKNKKINKINVALISVHTDVNKDSTNEVGIFMPDEITNLKYIFYQNLSDFNIVNNLSLNMTNDTNFQQSYSTSTPPAPITKNFIHQDGGILTSRDNISTNPKVHSYLRTQFLNSAINTKYSKWFTVFSFDMKNTSEYTSGGSLVFDNTALGEVEEIGLKNVVLYKPVGMTSAIPRDLTTLNHECMHGYGLRHTHRNGPIRLPEIEFIYPHINSVTNPLDATDNVMSYNSKALVLWDWQRKHIK